MGLSSFRAKIMSTAILITAKIIITNTKKPAYNAGFLSIDLVGAEGFEPPTLAL